MEPVKYRVYSPPPKPQAEPQQKTESETATLRVRKQCTQLCLCEICRIWFDEGGEA